MFFFCILNAGDALWKRAWNHGRQGMFDVYGRGGREMGLRTGLAAACNWTRSSLAAAKIRVSQLSAVGKMAFRVCIGSPLSRNKTPKSDVSTAVGETWRFIAIRDVGHDPETQAA